MNFALGFLTAILVIALMVGLFLAGGYFVWNTFNKHPEHYGLQRKYNLKAQYNYDSVYKEPGMYKEAKTIDIKSAHPNLKAPYYYDSVYKEAKTIDIKSAHPDLTIYEITHDDFVYTEPYYEKRFVNFYPSAWIFEIDGHPNLQIPESITKLAERIYLRRKNVGEFYIRDYDSKTDFDFCVMECAYESKEEIE